MNFLKKYQGAILFVLPILAFAFIFREIIFENKVFSYFDVLSNYLPYYFSESQSTNLINQSILAGFPSMVTISAAWFDPLRQLFFNFFDAIDTYRVLDLLYVLTAYVATFFYAKRIGMQSGAAALSGAVYIFAGQVMLWSAGIGISVYYAFLPLLMLAVDYAVPEKNIFKKGVLILGSALVLGAGWLMGHVQFLVYVYMLVSIYWAYLALRHYWKQKIKLGVEVLWFGLVLAISAAIGFPQIWAILDFLPLTVRGTMPLSSVYSYSYYPYHLIQYLIPSFSTPYLALPRAFHNYIGIIPLLIAFFGFTHFKRFKDMPHMIFFSVTFLLSLATAIYYSPFAALMHYLPVFNGFRETVRIMFLGDFALAICVGFFAQRLLIEHTHALQSPRYFSLLKRAFLWVFLPGIAVFTILKVFFIGSIEKVAKDYFLEHIYSHTTGKLPLEHYFSLIHTGIEQVVTQFSLINPDVFCFVVFGIVGYLILKSQSHKKEILWIVLVGAVSLNFAIVYANHVHGISKQELLSTPSTAAFLHSQQQKDGKDTRIISPLSGIPFYTEAVRCKFPNIGDWNMDEQTFLLHKELLDPNFNLYYNIDLIDGYEPYMTTKMSDLNSYLGGSFSLSEDEYGVGNQQNSIEEKMAQLVLRKNAYSAFNVGYMVTLVPVEHSGFTKVYEAPVGTCNTPVLIYAIENPWPRYFITNNTVEVPADVVFLDWMKKIDTLEKPTVVLNQKSMLQAATPFLQSVSPTFTKDGMTLDTTTTKNGYLYIGNAWLPGYKAAVDGIDVDILRVNYTMMGLYLPQGTHHIELHYTAVPPTLFKK